MDRRKDTSDRLNPLQGEGVNQWRFRLGWIKPDEEWEKLKAPKGLNESFCSLTLFVWHHRKGEFMAAASRINSDFTWVSTEQGESFWTKAYMDLMSSKSRWDVEDIYLEILGYDKVQPNGALDREKVKDLLTAHNLRDFERAAHLLASAFPWHNTPPSTEYWSDAHANLYNRNPLESSVLWRLQKMTVEPNKPHFFDYRGLPKRIEIRNGMTMFPRKE